MKENMLSKRLSFLVWAILAFQNLLFDLVASDFSGFYVDNGAGQTIMEKSILRTDVELMRHHILDLLDLPYRDDSERLPPHNRQVTW